MKDIKPYDPRDRKPHYTESQRRVARFFYEVEGRGISEIVGICGVSRSVLHRWKKKFDWVAGKYSDVMEKTELQARKQKAELLGIGVVDQMVKSKELMEAHSEETEMVPGTDENGNAKMIEVSKRIPDYKIQNEGLKRAMELTGTKIERKEIEHKGSQEIVHTYELPAKKPL